jgi:hypothetical protein
MSWYGNDSDEDHGDDISLDELMQSNSAYSGTELLGESSTTRRPRIGSIRDRASLVVQGARQLFLRDSAVRDADADAAGSNGQSTDDSGGGHRERVKSVAVDNLIDLDNADILRAGLQEALGDNAQSKGSWLVVDSSKDPGIPKSENAMDLSEPGQHRRHSSAHRGYDPADLAEVGMAPSHPTGNDATHDGGSHASASRAVSDFASALRDISGRVLAEQTGTGAADLETIDSPYYSHAETADRQRRLNIEPRVTVMKASHVERPPIPRIVVGSSDAGSSSSHCQQLSEQSDKANDVAGKTMVTVRRSHSRRSETDVSIDEGTDETYLIGKSLTWFSADNRIRRWLYRVVHQPWVQLTVFILLMLHTIVLSWQLSHNVFGDDPAAGGPPLLQAWGKSWGDWVILAIFVCYTIEIIAKIIVQGLWYDDPHSRFPGWMELVRRAAKRAKTITKANNVMEKGPGQPKNFNFVRMAAREVPIVLGTFTQLVQTGENREIPIERAFLRSSWHRIDMISVVSYWISLLFTIDGTDVRNQMFVFRALSSLRLLRMLNLTQGTASILRSLKKASPLLANVSVMIGFFW